MALYRLILAYWYGFIVLLGSSIWWFQLFHFHYFHLHPPCHYHVYNLSMSFYVILRLRGIIKFSLRVALQIFVDTFFLNLVTVFSSAFEKVALVSRTSVKIPCSNHAFRDSKEHFHVYHQHNYSRTLLLYTSIIL